MAVAVQVLETIAGSSELSAKIATGPDGDETPASRDGGECNGSSSDGIRGMDDIMEARLTKRPENIPALCPISPPMDVSMAFTNTTCTTTTQYDDLDFIRLQYKQILIHTHIYV